MKIIFVVLVLAVFLVIVSKSLIINLSDMGGAPGNLGVALGLSSSLPV